MTGRGSHRGFRFRPSWVIWLAVPLSGQALHLLAEPSVGSQGGTVTLDIESPPGQEPVALQWDFQIPLALRLDPPTMTAADQAKAAGKTVSCAEAVNLRGSVATFHCIAAGGTKPVGNGPLASLRFFPFQKERAGKYEFKIRNAISLRADLQKSKIEDVDSTLVVSK